MIYSTTPSQDLLFQAIHADDISYITEFISSNPDFDVDIKNKSGNSLLYHAVIKRNFNLIKFLIDKQADINLENSFGNTALSCLCLKPLNDSSGDNCLQILQHLINNGADVNSCNYFENTPLILSASSNKYEFIELLLLSGANVNSHNDEKETALGLACYLGHTLSVSALLQAPGIDIFTRNKENFSAIDLATRQQQTDIVQILHSYQNYLELKEAINSNNNHSNLVIKRKL